MTGACGWTRHRKRTCTLMGVEASDGVDFRRAPNLDNGGEAGLNGRSRAGGGSGRSRSREGVQGGAVNSRSSQGG